MDQSKTKYRVDKINKSGHLDTNNYEIKNMKIP